MSEAKEPSPASSAHLLKDQRIAEIALSDVGVESILQLLKQSVLSAKEFAQFLKKVASVESEHSSLLKKTARSACDSFRRPEMRKGTFQNQITQIVQASERVADVHNTFIESLVRLHDELIELVKDTDRKRKAIKDQGLKAEKALVEAETLAEKAKAKYMQVCEELERVRQGDASKKLGFKSKSEDELHRRMTVTEVDFEQKVDAMRRQRAELESKLRPETVSNLQGLILSCDAAVNLQVLRYANLCETLELNRGFAIVPRGQGAATSLKGMACKLDPELDYYNGILAIAQRRKQLNRPQVEFRKHMSSSFQPSFQASQPSQQPSQQGIQPTHTKSQTAKMHQAMPSQSAHHSTPSQSAHQATPSQSDHHIVAPSQEQPQAIHQPPQTAPQAAPEYNPAIHGLAVYATPLEDLLDDEEGTVPRVVYQCIQAIDNFGLEVEGIYRTSGNPAQVQEIKREFDIDAASVDLLRPREEVNDIHSVAAALKLYFQELPDPLLKREFHNEFLVAADIDKDVQRRDTVHAVINKLPDANYTTLRYLVFHLYRVQERQDVNGMSVSNLGLVWGPTLMATDYSNPAEMAAQAKVVETILVNAYAIFEAE